MGMSIDKCRTCKHAFTTRKDRLYCKKSLADKDDCGEPSGYHYCIFDTSKSLSAEEIFEQRASTCPLSEVLEDGNVD